VADLTPPHIADLLGRRVTVTGPNSSWTGCLVAYAPDPSVIIDTPGLRVCLPASYVIEATPEKEPS
jgi:hypothetical protein